MLAHFQGIFFQGAMATKLADDYYQEPISIGIKAMLQKALGNGGCWATAYCPWVVLVHFRSSATGCMWQKFYPKFEWIFDMQFNCIN
ncbi:hypothetical protein SLEP1_g656 [Rubroshorea leprosula]|uniref:Uncharacterized protein n=1 Tax=Rubroshorea leprosula TaxID=152421 RepID=A0AAV5HHY8_9ROSI|nr:hypothetical protein SLEP1_g656 [Rubroshorea leprosula]